MNYCDTSHSRFMWIMGIAAFFYVGGCNSSPNNGNTNCNTVGNACAAGSICLNNACIPLCNADNDCARNEICSSTTSICEVCPNCRQVPELATINGTGTTDTTPGHAAKHIADSIMLTGTHFSGSEVTIHGGNYDHVALVTRGDVTDTSLEAILPRDLTAGTYTLTIANQAGSDSTQATVLQGEKGDAGIYIAGDGIDVNGDTLSVVFGTEANTVARGNHLHAQYAEKTELNTDIATVNTTITTTQTNLTSTITALQNAMDGVMRPCNGGNTSVRTYNGNTGTWSDCVSTTWSCATSATHAGCDQNATSGTTYSSCAAILRDGYNGPDRALWIDTDGAGTAVPFQVYCDMSAASGGWTFAFNLDTDDGQLRHYGSTFWPTSTSSTDVIGAVVSSIDDLNGDKKTMAFNTVPATELMIILHDDGIIRARAYYQLKTEYKGTPLRNLFATLSHVEITESRMNVEGASARYSLIGTYAADGTTTRAGNVGDPFIATAQPILINADFHANPPTGYAAYFAGSFTSDVHKARLTVDYTTPCATLGCNGHNMGGWGGLHGHNASGGYEAVYEGSALCAYCIGATGGCVYGSDFASMSDIVNTYASYFPGLTLASNANGSACGGRTPPQLDLAVFVR